MYTYHCILFLLIGCASNVATSHNNIHFFPYVGAFIFNIEKSDQYKVGKSFMVPLYLSTAKQSVISLQVAMHQYSLGDSQSLENIVSTGSPILAKLKNENETDEPKVEHYFMIAMPGGNILCNGIHTPQNSQNLSNIHFLSNPFKGELYTNVYSFSFTLGFIAMRNSGTSHESSDNLSQQVSLHMKTGLSSHYTTHVHKKIHTMNCIIVSCKCSPKVTDNIDQIQIKHLHSVWHKQIFIGIMCNYEFQYKEIFIMLTISGLLFPNILPSAAIANICDINVLIYKAGNMHNQDYTKTILSIEESIGAPVAFSCNRVPHSQLSFIITKSKKQFYGLFLLCELDVAMYPSSPNTHNIFLEDTKITLALGIYIHCDNIPY